MKIEIFPLGELAANCYLVSDNGEAIAIDVPDDGVFVAEKIYEKGLKLKAIIATHGHFDHILGAGELQMILPAPFFINKKDEFLLKKMNDSAKYWLAHPPAGGLVGGFKNPLPSNVEYFKEGSEIKFGKCCLKIMESPGHTPGSVCLELKNKKDKNAPVVLFTGDTLFQGDIGRFDFSYASEEELKKSLQKIFKKFPQETVIYPGHGEISKLVNENEFYRWAKIIL